MGRQRFGLPSRAGARGTIRMVPDFGDHQPMCGRFGGVKHRVGCPDIADVLDAQAWVLEQVGGLGVDLERVLVVEQIEIEPVVPHVVIVIQTDTNSWWPRTLRGFRIGRSLTTTVTTTVTTVTH
jgi:hypothetical protein